jgi:PPOX class probable F420-dependent enzyme
MEVALTIESVVFVLTPQVRAFLADAVRYATIATLNPDGSPHSSIVWYLVRGDQIVVNSRAGRRWPSNLRRDPRISFAVEQGEDAVTIDSLADEMHDPEAAQADIAEMAARYDTPEMARREVARFLTEQRVTFVLRPQRVHVHGDPR